MITIKTKKNEYDVIVPQFRKEEFGVVEEVNKGDFVSVVGERSMNVVFCKRFKNLIIFQ